MKAWMAASAGGTDRDLAATQFLGNCVAKTLIFLYRCWTSIQKKRFTKQPLFPKFLDKPRFELWNSQSCNELSTELPAGIAFMAANAPLEPPLNETFLF